MLHCIVVQHRHLNQHQLPTPEPTPKPNPATTAPKIVAKPKSVSPKTIKATKKKYYVRVRTYKIVNGKKVYSSWSKVKSVKTK